MTAPKEAALSRNTPPLPNAAIRKPEIAGPIRRALLKEVEFKATALGISSSLTSSETKV